MNIKWSWAPLPNHLDFVCTSGVRKQVCAHDTSDNPWSHIVCIFYSAEMTCCESELTCRTWILIILPKGQRLDVNTFFHPVFVWRSVFGYGGRVTAAGDRCHFIEAAERSESPVPAEIRGAAWRQGGGCLLSASCGSVPGAHALWSAFKICYFYLFPDTVYSFHS